MSSIALSLYVGLQAKFEVRAPFDATTHSQFTYTVTSIRTLADIIASGDDPMQVYTDNQISDEEYVQDLKANVSVIGLQNGSSPTIYIPETFIVSVPTITGVPTRPLVLTVHLGMIPDEMNLENLEDLAKKMVLGELGVEAQTALVAVGASELISTQEHERREAQRKVAVTFGESQGAVLIRLEKENTLLKKQIQELAKALQARM